MFIKVFLKYLYCCILNFFFIIFLVGTKGFIIYQKERYLISNNKRILTKYWRYFNNTPELKIPRDPARFLKFIPQSRRISNRCRISNPNGDARGVCLCEFDSLTHQCPGLLKITHRNTSLVTFYEALVCKPVCGCSYLTWYMIGITAESEPKYSVFTKQYVHQHKQAPIFSKYEICTKTNN